MKKLISIVFIIAIFASSFVYASGDNDTSIKDAYDQGYNDGYSDGKGASYKPKVPYLTIVEDKNMPEVKAGEEIYLKVTYKNESEYSAYDIKITPIFDGSILEYERPTYFETERALRTDREDVATFNLKIKPETKIGIYELKFKM